MVDDWIKSPLVASEDAIMSQYWQNIFHVKDSSPAPDPSLLLVANGISHNYLASLRYSICLLYTTDAADE